MTELAKIPDLMSIEDFEDPREWLTCEILHLCGCENPGPIEALFWEILDGVANKNLPDRDDIAFELALKVLDRAELIEHGSNIFDSQLTLLGKDVHQTIVRRFKVLAARKRETESRMHKIGF